MTELEHRLTVLNEGRRTHPYVDTVGKITIGVGHNLTDRGLPDYIINLLLAHDYEEAQQEVVGYFPWANSFDPVRKAVLVDLVFNMGITKVKRFRSTLAALEAKDFEGAATHLRQSLWFNQVGERGPRMLAMLRTGEWPAEIVNSAP